MLNGLFANVLVEDFCGMVVCRKSIYFKHLEKLWMCLWFSEWCARTVRRAESACWIFLR